MWSASARASALEARRAKRVGGSPHSKRPNVNLTARDLATLRNLFLNGGYPNVLHGGEMPSKSSLSKLMASGHVKKTTLKIGPVRTIHDLTPKGRAVARASIRVHAPKIIKDRPVHISKFKTPKATKVKPDKLTPITPPFSYTRMHF